ncbi:hypothetical protein DdX_16946 [Ditylenchus destructor]|uniref:Uncharacterized protein n=1 Tax=Ditylenchus destructor TaxID=166010 RepID=A0AAD4MSC6_9BILA|nr:hypothetical protein DdX_16946 [Ditylenchus destructor]
MVSIRLWRLARSPTRIGGMPNYVRCFLLSDDKREQCVLERNYQRLGGRLRCDESQNITLNIGSNGNTADSNTKQLVLTGADYIGYLGEPKKGPQFRLLYFLEIDDA